MGDNFKPSLGRGSAYGMDVFQGPSTRRRMSMGVDASMDTEQDRDPEGQVEDFDELVRRAQTAPLPFFHHVLHALCCSTWRAPPQAVARLSVVWNMHTWFSDLVNMRGLSPGIIACYLHWAHVLC